MTDPAAPATDTPGATAANAPEPLPPSSFADPKSSMGVVPLKFPVLFGGRTWSEIHLRVFTTAQVAAVIRNYDRRRQVDPEAALSFPVYVDADGVDVPDGLMQQLAQDDVDDVAERATDFLPRRFRPTRVPTAAEAMIDDSQTGSSPSIGASTEPSSPT